MVSPAAEDGEELLMCIVKYPGLKARGLSLKQKFRDHRPIDVDPIT